MSHLSIVFPGQGSQSVGMLSDIAEQYPEIKETFVEASDVLHLDLWKLSQTGPKEELDKTMHTQPALLAASYAMWRLLAKRMPLSPMILAGHSLGEYTALVCAESLAYQDAIQLVALRGQYMQAAVPEGVGAMAAIIGLEEAMVATICDELRQNASDVLSPANFNSVGQVVIAGHRALVEQAMIVAKEKGAKMVVLIPVSVPSHCELMKEAAHRLADKLNELTIREPRIAVIGNADVMPYTTDASIRDGLVRQLYSPVRWVETIRHMMQQGVTDIIECGPGKVLTGLNKRIDKSLQLFSTTDVGDIEKLLNSTSERRAS